MLANTTMLTASCILAAPDCWAWRRFRTGNQVPERLRRGTRPPNQRLLYIESLPVLHLYDAALVAVPAVDAIVLVRAEVVLLGPLDRPAAQSFGVDLDVAHGCREFLSRSRPARGFQCRLDHH